ncbi:unnamed protein product [Choristocarpus tenellus]
MNATSEEEVVISDDLTQEGVRGVDFTQDETGGIDLTHAGAGDAGAGDIDLTQEGSGGDVDCGGWIFGTTTYVDDTVATWMFPLEGVEVNAIVPGGFLRGRDPLQRWHGQLLIQEGQ